MLHESNKFLHNIHAKTFTSEASTLTAAGWFPLFSQFYPSNTPAFSIISNKTNNTSDWLLEDTEMVDGDLVKWTLAPTEETTKRIPALRGYKAIVFND
jgi:hypothetical protein